MEIKFQGSVKNGSLKFNDRESFSRFIQSMEGKTFTLHIKETKQVRSLGLNNYYWAVVIPHVKLGLIDVGYDADELDNEIVHEFLKSKFLKKEVYSASIDMVLKVTERSSALDNKRFKEYIERIQRWSIEFLHTYVPDINEHITGLGSQH